jgi:hypothetical protein
MKPSAARTQAESSSIPRRAVTPRTVLVVAGIIGLLGVLVAMFERRTVREPAPQQVAPGREGSSQRAPSATVRTPGPRPALPPAAPAHAALAERPSARAETKLVLTQIKAQKYVDEAYPAWLRAHPGGECPRQLIELNDYMDDKDVNDAWGRPMRMQCVPLPTGAKGIKVVSSGRDAEFRSEDDIRFGP